MVRWALPILCAAAMALAGCAAVPAKPVAVETLLHDELFPQPLPAVVAADVFSLSSDMQRYLDTEVLGAAKQARDPRRQLVQALYDRRQLQLEYDSTVTRNAQEAFDARSGNCLSLVIMTASFAKAMGLPVQYNAVEVEENWTRNGDLYFAAGHVNLTLGKSSTHWRPMDDSSPQLMIDFLPQAEMRRLRITPVEESTVLAMFMNNRAAETLSAGQMAQAYAWARAAVLQDRRFLPAYNTLGVIYQRHGNLAQAEQVFTHLMGREPGNTKVMANLVRVLEAQGRRDDARVWAERLAAIEPHPPFEYFRAGMAAMRIKDYKTAREQFAREVARAPENDEFHFWLALAHMGLGEVIEARRQLMRAVETSSTSQSRNVYVGKLEKLRAVQTH